MKFMNFQISEKRFLSIKFFCFSQKTFFSRIMSMKEQLFLNSKKNVGNYVCSIPKLSTKMSLLIFFYQKSHWKKNSHNCYCKNTHLFLCFDSVNVIVFITHKCTSVWYAFANVYTTHFKFITLTIYLSSKYFFLRFVMQITLKFNKQKLRFHFVPVLTVQGNII